MTSKWKRIVSPTIVTLYAKERLVMDVNCSFLLLYMCEHAGGNSPSCCLWDVNLSSGKLLPFICKFFLHFTFAIVLGSVP